MEAVLGQVEQLPALLAVSRSALVRDWDSLTLDRALEWARYFQHLHDRFRARPQLREALGRRLRRSQPCPLLGFPALGRCPQLLRLALLENRALPPAACRRLLRSLLQPPGAGPASDPRGLGLLARRKAAARLLALPRRAPGPEPQLQAEARLLLSRLRQEGQEAGEAAGQLPRLCGAQEEQQAAGQLRRLCGAQEGQEAAGQLRRLCGAPEGQQAAGQLRRLCGAQEGQEAAGQLRRLCGAQEGQEAGEAAGQLRRLCGAQEGQGAGGQLRWLCGAQEEQQAAGQLRRLCGAQEGQGAGGQLRRLCGAQEAGEAAGQLPRLCGAPEGQQAGEAAGQLPRLCGAPEGQQAGEAAGQLPRLCGAPEGQQAGEAAGQLRWLCGALELLPQPRAFGVVAAALALLKQGRGAEQAGDGDGDGDGDGSSSPGGYQESAEEEECTAGLLLSWLLGNQERFSAFCLCIPCSHLAFLAGHYSQLSRSYLDLLTNWGRHLHYDPLQGRWVKSCLDKAELSWEELRERFICLCQGSTPLKEQTQAALELLRTQDGDFRVRGLSVWTDLLMDMDSSCVDTKATGKLTKSSKSGELYLV